MNGKIYKGSTQTFRFRFPYVENQVTNLAVIFAQNGECRLEKNIDDCELDGDILEVTLTPQETNLFSHKLYLQTQLYYKLYTGETKATEVSTFSVHRVLRDSTFEPNGSL